MPKKLFVGGLPFVYSDSELQALFASFGNVVSAVMVFDPDRARSRGFGFVEMSTPEEGSAAIAKLNGTPMGEKKIYVTEAKEKKATPPEKPEAGGPYRKPLHRKVGRNPLGRSSASYPPNPYSTPPSSDPAYEETPRTPGAFGRFQKKGFSQPGNPRSGFGSRDRRPGSDSPRDAPRSGFGFRGRPGSDAPRGGFGGESRGRSGPPRGERTPGSFGHPPNKGFSKPGKWEPRDDGKRSFSAPRNARGDFGPSDRKPSHPSGDSGNRRSRPDSRPSDSSGRPPKREFWRKFEKKK